MVEERTRMEKVPRTEMRTVEEPTLTQRTRPVTPEEELQHRNLTGEVEKLKADREAIIDDYIKTELDPYFSHKYAGLETGKAQLHPSVANIGSTFDDVAGALKAKSGKLYDRIRQSVDRTLREGKYTDQWGGGFQIEPDVEL